MTSGQGRVSAKEVITLVQKGQASEVVAAASLPGASNVKRKQVAQGLISAQRFSEALNVVLGFARESGAEARNVAMNVVNGMDPKNPTLTTESGEWQFLIGIHDALGPRQRLIVKKAILRQGLPRSAPGQTSRRSLRNRDNSALNRGAAALSGAASSHSESLRV